jgi:hypothetical protein
MYTQTATSKTDFAEYTNSITKSVENKKGR